MKTTLQLIEERMMWFDTITNQWCANCQSCNGLRYYKSKLSARNSLNVSTRCKKCGDGDKQFTVEGRKNFLYLK